MILCSRLALKEIFLRKASFPGSKDFVCLFLFLTAVVLLLLFLKSVSLGLRDKVDEVVLGKVENHGVAMTLSPSSNRFLFSRENIEFCDPTIDASCSVACDKEKHFFGCKENAQFYLAKELRVLEAGGKFWNLDDHFWCFWGLDNESGLCKQGNPIKTKRKELVGLSLDKTDPLWIKFSSNSNNISPFPLEVILNKELFQAYFNFPKYVDFLLENQLVVSPPTKVDDLEYFWVSYHGWKRLYNVPEKNWYKEKKYLPLKIHWAKSFPTNRQYGFLFPLQTYAYFSINSHRDERSSILQTFHPETEGMSISKVTSFKVSSRFSSILEHKNNLAECLNINGLKLERKFTSYQFFMPETSQLTEERVISCLRDISDEEDFQLALKNNDIRFFMDTTINHELIDSLTIKITCPDKGYDTLKWNYPTANDEDKFVCNNGEAIIDLFSGGDINMLRVYSKNAKDLYRLKTKLLNKKVCGSGNKKHDCHEKEDMIELDPAYEKSISRASFLSSLVIFVDKWLHAVLFVSIFFAYIFMIFTLINHRKSNYALLRVSGFSIAELFYIFLLQVFLCAVAAFILGLFIYIFVIQGWLNTVYFQQEATILSLNELGASLDNFFENARVLLDVDVTIYFFLAIILGAALSLSFQLLVRESYKLRKIDIIAMIK